MNPIVKVRSLNTNLISDKIIGIDNALGNPSHNLTIFSKDDIHDNQSPLNPLEL